MVFGYKIKKGKFQAPLHETEALPRTRFRIFPPKKRGEKEENIPRLFGKWRPLRRPELSELHDLYFTRKGRKDNGVIFISVSREKIEKK